LRLGWGCITWGEGPSSVSYGNSKLNAVLNSLFIMCVLFIDNCRKQKIIWAKIGATQPSYGQNRTVWWHRLVWSDTVILVDCNMKRTVWDNYGQYRKYGPKSNFTA